MPVSADLPPLPTHEAFEPLRDMLDEARRDATDRQFIDLCRVLRTEWQRLAPHLSADLGYPTKKLTRDERAKARAFAAAGVGADDVTALLRWLDNAIVLLSNLRRARAA